MIKESITPCVVLSVDDAFGVRYRGEDSGSPLVSGAHPTSDTALQWHLSVRQVREDCKELLSKLCGYTVLIDDTLHLPSMRKAFFRIAREGAQLLLLRVLYAFHGCTSIAGGHKYATIHLKVSLDDALQRLSRRSSAAPAHSFVTEQSATAMHSALSSASIPDWERAHFSTLDTSICMYVLQGRLVADSPHASSAERNVCLKRCS